MAISSIHIEAGSGGYFAHNSREQSTVNSIFSDEQNFVSCTKEDAFKLYRSELEKRTEAYKENHNRTKLHAKTITHLSAIVNFNKEHTPEDMQRVCDLLERKLDTKVIQFAMHRDEGHIKEDGTPDKNYHAHIEFMGLDSKGESVRRKLDRPMLKALQNDVAKTLGMTRGKDYAKERSPRPKRLDTYEYKTHKEEISKAVKEAVLATEKDLKAEVAQLRSQLKEQGATRADYAELEQINRELREQIKAKDLTVDQLTLRLDVGYSMSKKQQEQITALEAENTQLKNMPKEVQTEFIQDPKIVQENTELRQKLAQKDSEIMQVKEENKELKAQNTELSKTETRSAAPSIDIEQIEEVKKMQQISPSVSLPNSEERNDLSTKLKKDNAIDDLVRSCYKKVEDKGLFTTTTKTVFDTKAFIGKVKERESDHQRLHTLNDKIIVAVVDKIKSVVEITKTGLEALKSKIMGKSLSEPKKELTELLEKRTGLFDDLKKTGDYFDRLKDQEKDQGKTLSQSIGRGFGLGR